ncbi:hypothetical protein V6N13_019623 [Hibiscus sabdariffa]|uniref:C2H2-type domain-containing protein n=1 Tax=Hibiscus sabdariffa TaxID=183260 RepID=A0ABR2EK46_9ROSI
METEKADKASSDEHGASPARSYDCTFCKRGFSNAQALGGHMNIHRRDKAKLKQASPTRENSQQSLEIPNHPSSTTCKDESSHGKWPWVLQDDDDDDDDDKAWQAAMEIRQLPLFDEKPTITDHQNPSTEKGFSSSQLGSSGSEVDLELRLGPQPKDSSPPTRTTENFF